MSSVLVNIGGADEAYLISLSNKGLYNRAVRELPDSGLIISVEGEKISGLFSDGVSVIINGSIADYRCSCPSRTVCKHLLMTVLGVKRDILEGAYFSAESGETTTVLDIEHGAGQSVGTKAESNAGQVADPEAVADSGVDTDPKIVADSGVDTEPRIVADSGLSTYPRVESNARQVAEPEAVVDSELVAEPRIVADSDPRIVADSEPRTEADSGSSTYPRVESNAAQVAEPEAVADSGLVADPCGESCADKTIDPSNDETPNPFAYILDATDAQLMKLAGKKAYGAALLEAKFGERAAIQESGSLAITLPDNGETVRFLPTGSLNTAVCTCKSGNFCVHRVQAVLEYIINKNGELPAESDLKEEKAGFEYGGEALTYIKEFVYEVFASGLARLPEDSASRFLQLATICHSRRLANPERLCNRIAGQLRHFDRKSAAFNRENLVGDLCALYNLADRIEKEGGTPATVGVFRDQYQPVGPMEIWGLGAYGWHSAGGYTGVTTLFFSLKLNRVLRFTVAMPDNVSPGADKLYNSGAPWSINSRLSGLSHSRLSIKGAKLNASGQLSSTESCKAEALGAADIHDPALTKLRFEDFSLLADALWIHLEQQNEGTNTAMTALVTPDRADKGAFDRVTQTFRMPLYDSEGRTLNISVKFEESTRLLLTNLALLDDEFETWGYGMFLVNVYIDDGKLTAFPITYFGKKIRNLSLDVEAVKKHAKRKFEWDTP